HLARPLPCIARRFSVRSGAVKELLHFVKRESLWPLLVVVVGALVLLPGLGSHGFWEPHEIRVADLASARVGLSGADQPDTPGPYAPPDAAAPAAAAAAPAARSDARPPLTEWSAGQGMKHIGSSELGARLPIALLGLIALVTTFFLGRRLAS